ncbi:cryptochrome/photolyase family protein [Aestuariivirga litoralis]|uniref:cryptochrome/photolyase family protein n=1 Tax=Aestuariivirga litoralis TaxID=2650924 RepID=UPI0018C535E4|nr:deoxyribodipyrimidine photo-lyase [Aestuariivirga litoralis]MBG1232780.1 deoxyribodipyrimidine photo-lyase [Aestuariivirga litoralis]
MAPPILLWLRQDLRLSDHPALTAAAAKGAIIPLYVLDDDTPGEWRWGGASRWWLHHSLAALGKNLPLVLRKGRADDVIAEVLKQTEATSLHFTRDYAPWSPALESCVKKICDDLNVTCHRHGGFLLHEPEAIKNGSGETYKVFTPFSRACFASGEPRAPKPVPKFEIAKHGLKSDRLDDWQLTPSKPDWAKSFEGHWQPGEQGAQKALASFIDDALEHYADGRDRPDQPLTSRLSPHLHWGEISPHQAWSAIRAAMDRKLGKLDHSAEKFLNEVLWREFSNHLLVLFPDFPTKSYRPEFDDMPWAKSADHLHKWQKGQTGYPIVDAGMRELWATGFMHNRVRMVVASFLIKHLQIDWREGERWFWDTLVDADIANNAASWQWVAGSGADASPYYRIFNPVLQGVKFDPQGDYVKRWVPELKHVSAEFIHAPWNMPNPPADYPAPMVDHAQARTRAMAALASIKKEQA